MCTGSTKYKGYRVIAWINISIQTVCQNKVESISSYQHNRGYLYDIPLIRAVQSSHFYCVVSSSDGSKPPVQSKFLNQ